MIDLLNEIASYIAARLAMTAGTNVFYYEMPDNLDTGILIEEPKEGHPVIPQIDAEHRYLRFVIRDTTNTAGLILANKCYSLFMDNPDVYLMNSKTEYITDFTDALVSVVDDTNFIVLPNGLVIFVQLNGPPRWEKTDTKNRKHFCFSANVITKRTN